MKEEDEEEVGMNLYLGGDSAVFVFKKGGGAVKEALQVVIPISSGSTLSEAEVRYTPEKEKEEEDVRKKAWKLVSANNVVWSGGSCFSWSLLQWIFSKSGVSFSSSLFSCLLGGQKKS